MPRSVVEAMADYLFHHNANTHWTFPTSGETDLAIASAREAFADFLGALPEEVAFGANMTTLTFHLARALGRGLEAGDEIVVTELDHHANVDPWRDMAREQGAVVRTARLDTETGELDLDDFRCQINDRTRIVAVGAASNALGSMPDIVACTRMAHEVGALAFVDAVHFAPHRLVDVREIGCDFLACSAYKFYGPHLGILYGRRELIERLDLPKLRPAPEGIPDRLETGTQNHEGIVGAASAVDFLASLAEGPTRRARLAASFESLHERSHALIESLWDGLAGISAVRIYGPPQSRPRTPTVSFTIEAIPAAEVSRLLADRGFFVSHGDFYASTAVERLGIARDGLVRIGCACYASEEEIAALVDEVRGIARG